MDAAEQFLSNPWVVAGVTSVIVAVVVLLLTLRATRKVGQILLTAWSSNLVTSLKTQASGLAVTFKGEEIPSATVARIVVWNDGNVVIRRESLEPKDPVTVELAPGLRLLDLTPLHVSDSLGGFRTGVGKGPKGGESFSIDFDYLKPKNGAALQLVYTGTGVKDLLLSGTLIDQPPPKWTGIRRRWLSNLFMLIFMGFMFSAIFILLLPFNTQHHELTKALYLLVWGVPALTLFLLRGHLGQLVFRVPTALRPFSEGTTAKSKAG
jgi:hypothetical protein